MGKGLLLNNSDKSLILYINEKKSISQISKETNKSRAVTAKLLKDPESNSIKRSFGRP
jgi:hypothetical protein